MTIQTTLLDARLAQAVAKAQQAAAARPAAGNNSRVVFDLPAGLAADLQRTLRQFGLLQRERTSIESAIAVAPAARRGPEQSRLASFDADLARLLARAARLAFLLRALDDRHGRAVGAEAAQAVQYLASVFGQTLDPTRVRRTVQQLGIRPMGAVDGVEPAALVETLFIALALALVLAHAPPDAGSA